MNLQKLSGLCLFSWLILVSHAIVADVSKQPLAIDNETSDDTKSGIYRNVTEDGVVEFSDQNYSDSKKIKLKSSNTFKAAKKKVKPVIITEDDETEPQHQLHKTTNYTQLSISSPTPDQQIRSNSGLLTVSILINPTLNAAAGDQIELFYDGRSQGKQANTVFNLKDVYRGQHRVQAKILDKNGAVLKTSKPSQFVIFKFSILFNKTKPDIKPEPEPEPEV